MFSPGLSSRKRGNEKLVKKKKKIILTTKIMKMRGKKVEEF